MRRSTNSILLIITVLAAAMFPGPARAQSGRGRPKVPTPSPGTPPPQPVTIPAVVSVVKQEQVGNISRFLLRNGITVIISEQHSAPIAASAACFKAGTRDEPDTATGIARLVSRAITSGNRRPLVDLRSTGSLLRAGVALESSTYSLVAPSARLKEALKGQADLLLDFNVNVEDMRRAAALLVEEEKWNPISSFDLLGRLGQESPGALADSNPSAYSLARLVNLALPGIASVKPLSLERLNLITPEQLEAFYRAHYRPENLIIAVAGDVVPFTTLVQIQQLYANFGVQTLPASEPTRNSDRPAAKGGAPASSNATRQFDQTKGLGSSQQSVVPAPQSEDAEQSKLRYGEDRADISQSIVSIGYHVPGPESREWAIIEVLSAVAGIGRASRLQSALIDGQITASRVDAVYLAHKNGAMLVFQFRPAGDATGASIDKAESTFFREIERMRREAPSEGETIRAKAVLQKRFIDRNESYAGRAKELARSEALMSGLRGSEDYRTAIAAVKAEDIQRAAAKYFALSNTTVHEYESQAAPTRTFDADSFSATVIAWAPEIARPVVAASPPANDPNAVLAAQRGVERSAQQQADMESLQPLPVKDFSTLNGPRAFVREDRSTPKVTVALLFQGGRLVETETTSGTTELMLRTLLYGTARRTRQQLAQEWEQLGAEVELVVEPDFFGFLLSVLSRNADHTLKLLRDCIEDPAFRDDDTQRARVEQIGAIRESGDSSLARSRELLVRALYPGTPYGLPPHGREDLTARITSEQLREWHSRMIKRQLPLAIIVGDTNGSALVSSQLAEAFRRRELDTALPVRVPSAARASEQIELRRREQTVASIGLAGPKAADGAGQDAVEVIKAALNGIGGRLEQETVDKGLAVIAKLESAAWFAAETVLVELVTSPSDEQRARTALLAEIEKLSKGALSAAEVAVAGTLAASTRLDALQSQRRRALEYARAVIAQQKAQDVDTAPERLSKVTAEDIKRAATVYLKSASAGVVRASQPSPPQSK